MTFEPGEDLSMFLNFLDRMLAPLKAQWQPNGQRFHFSTELDALLEDNGFLDAASEASLGLPAASMMVMEVAKFSSCAEVSASSLLRPVLCPSIPRPMAVIWGDVQRPTRFLPMARSVLHIREDGVFAALLGDGDVIQEESLFAYPMGRLKPGRELDWQRLTVVEPATVADLWRVAVASEMVGCGQSGLDAVVTHVSERRQFGRPLGSFQAIQHRLASCAASIQGARWLTLKAAHSRSSVDAATALGHAQAASTSMAYDLHQFMGAMGLTLEHPLHRWTYRVKLLRSELGGADRQFAAAANLAWNTSHPE